MKKSTIWILTIVMAITFGALLYFQIMYLENMVKMRREQFSENVMRSLYATAGYIEKEETLHFLQEDANIIESNLYDYYYPVSNNSLNNSSVSGNVSLKYDNSFGSTSEFESQSAIKNIPKRYQDLQDVIRSQYLYQRGLINEVILTILRDSSSRPIIERADSTMVRSYFSNELANNGINIPFTFAIFDNKNNLVYAEDDYNIDNEKNIYSQVLFPNSDGKYTLKVFFPTRNNYIFSNVRFVIPSLIFTVILLFVFIFTIILALRQKKITEMKTDFINNMTHELKTPISTISLAGQMLSDESIRKLPSSLNHLSQVITEESKRLRFLVDKVLQLSVLDKSIGTSLKFTVVDANAIISNIEKTFKIKIEKFGGKINCVLDASNPYVYVDEMQFTNVIFNLLDNAVKYMKEDEAPMLEIKTKNIENNKLRISVKDNGIGIKKDDLKHIFEKFFRVSTGNLHDVKGFGLGLAYVDKMIKLFNGTISVESEFGVGTVFIISLPVADETLNEN